MNRRDIVLGSIATATVVSLPTVALSSVPDVTTDYTIWLKHKFEENEISPGLPVKMASGAYMDYDGAKILAASCNGFMLKPEVEVNGVKYKAITRVVRSWDEFNHIPKDSYIYELTFRGEHPAYYKIAENYTDVVKLDKPGMNPSMWFVRFGVRS